MCGKPTYLISCVLIISVVLQGIACGADPGPVGWWTFDDGSGTVARDASGNGNDGTLYGDPQWAEGQLGGALQLDGDGDYVELPIGSIISPLEEATLTLWVNWSGLGGSWQRILDFGSGTTSYLFLCPSNGANGAMRTSITAGNDVWNEFDSEEPLATGWHHITITVSSSSQTMMTYVDGAVVGSLSNIINTLDALGETTQNWIGRSQYDADPYFNGAVDDLRIYDVILSEDSIRMVMEGLVAGVASDPTPADGVVDVPRGVILSWAPGEFAQTHDVYFSTAFEDVNAAERATPLDVLVSQDQTATLYDPEGLLEFGQTYYWRIDEVNAAPDNTTFRGEVWSFMAEPLAYQIENIVATSNTSSDAGFSPESSIDGSGLNADDQHSTLNTDMWAGSPPAGELAYIEYDFGKVYKLYEMQVWNYNVVFELMLGFGFKDVTIEYSENGTDWTTLKEVQFAQGTARSDYTANTIVDLEGVPARFVRLTANTGYGPMGQFGLSEVRFLYTPAQAREPEPADGATEAAVDTILTWRAGSEAASHEVYFGIEAEALPLVDTATESQYDLGGLDLGTTYYWQIDEVNEAEAINRWAGALWSFATQEYLVVDDFESYDDEDNVIYETWIDGWVNETGSTVGYLEAPFAERTIIHGGRQAMPLFYSNLGGISVSEVELTLAPAQNWTQAGVTTLVVYFHGDLDNDAAQVYVKINGTKVSGGGSTTMTLWKQWDIDLAATGANLSNVTKVIVGVEGSGEGVIYVDDIRLYRAAPAVVTPVDPGTNGLAAQYLFEDNVNDVTGNGYDGTPMNDPFYEDAAGDLGRAMSFNGINNYVELPIGSLISSLTDMTVAIWVNFTNTGGDWQRLFDFGTSNTEGYMFLCPRTGGSGPMHFTITPDSGGGASMIETTNTLPSGWHHVAAVIDSTDMTISLYVDGALAASGETATLPQDLGTPTQNWLGRSQYAADGYFTGSLADFSMYSRALSAGEVSYLAGAR